MPPTTRAKGKFNGEDRAGFGSSSEAAAMATGSSLSQTKRKLRQVKGKESNKKLKPFAKCKNSLQAMASPIEERENPHPPWDQLPAELLHIISQKLADDISHFIRFRCVCRPWRHAAEPSDLSPQLPWLLLPYAPKSSIRSFFSFVNQSIRTIRLPETRNQNICGSSNGWLIMHDKALNISLFNPITRSLIRLPPITLFPGDLYGFRLKETSPGDVRLIKGRRGVEVTLRNMDHWFDCLAFLSSDPESVNAVDGVVVFMQDDTLPIQYCKLGDTGWTVLDPGLGREIKTMSFHKGSFYFVDFQGRTAVRELGLVKKEAVMIPPVKFYPGKFTSNYLVTVCEELLLVSCRKNYLDSCNNDFVIEMFEYYKLEVGSGGTMTWSQIGGAGDCSVFLTNGRMCLGGRLMNVASSAPGYRKECVYYAVPPKRCRSGLSSMRVMMADGGDIGMYHGPWAEMKPKSMSSSWIVPSLC